MLNILLSFLTFVLILVSLFMVLVILMQRASSNSGMGSAFGGGVTESAFGAETTNILTRATKWSAFAFFILSLVLYLLYMSRADLSDQPAEVDLPDIPVTAQEEIPMVPETAEGLEREATSEMEQASEAASDEAVPAETETETPPAP